MLPVTALLFTASVALPAALSLHGLGEPPAVLRQCEHELRTPLALRPDLSRVKSTRPSRTSMRAMSSDLLAPDPATVVVIDDHDIVRIGLQTLVDACPDLRFAGSAGSLREGLELIAAQQPGLVITDMGTKDSSGLQTVRAVVAAQGSRATIVVSMQDELLYGEQVLALGARAYLMKESAHAMVIPAALTVLNGGTWVSPRLNARLPSRFLHRARPAPVENTAPHGMELTLREIEVLQLLKSGRTTKEIAAALELSARTVDIHRANIKRKLHLRSGAELIAYASSRL